MVFGQFYCDKHIWKLQCLSCACMADRVFSTYLDQLYTFRIIHISMYPIFYEKFAWRWFAFGISELSTYQIYGRRKFRTWNKTSIYLMYEVIDLLITYSRRYVTRLSERTLIYIHINNSNRLHREWTDNFPYDFRDERMMKELKDMTQRLVAINSELRKDISILNHNLFSKLSSLQKYEDLLTRINAEVAQRLLNIMPTVSWWIIQFIFEICMCEQSLPVVVRFSRMSYKHNLKHTLKKSWCRKSPFPVR